MELYRLILERRTVHEYAARPLAEGALERAIRAAIAAPNHALTEPWRFTQVGRATRERLLAIGVDLVTNGGESPLSPAAESRLEITVINPAELLVVSQVLDAHPVIRQEDYAAVACAIQNLTLSLWSEGIGSKWGTEDFTEHPRMYSALQIDSDRERIVGFLWLGYPMKAHARKPRRKRPLHEVLRVLP